MTIASNDVRLSAVSRSSLESGMSTPSFLFNLLLANAALNALLLPCALLSSSLFGGTTAHRSHHSSLLLASLLSCVHASFIAILLGDRVSDAFPPSSRSSAPSRLANALRAACESHGSDPYVRGAALGSTIVLAVLMRVASSGWGGGGGGSEPESSSATSSSGSIASFLSGLLSWLDAAMAASMYAAKRREGMSSSSSSLGGDYDGGGGGFGLGGIGDLLLFSTSSSTNRGNDNRQYDEIGDGLGFAGDFPSSSGLGSSATATTTIRV